MGFPIDYYVANYSPPSTKVAFTWTTDMNEHTIDVDPLYLAAISSLYRTIPHCDTFEINQRNTIMGDEAALCFFTLLPLIDGWDETERSHPLTKIIRIVDQTDKRWSIWILYQASELCNFLGIKASSYGISNSITPIAGTIVPFHQMFLETDCEAGITICEEICRQAHISSTVGIGSIGNYNKKLRSHYNANYRCIIEEYIRFATRAKDLDANIKTFMKEQLGWNDEDQRFGVQISLNGNNQMQ